MNKSIEAFIRGYILFDVNGTKYMTYKAALAQRKAISGDVHFTGFHILKGWRTFFFRVCI